MRELESSITRKGQVTIPAEIRNRLGLKPHDKVRFKFEGEVVRITPAQSRIARHFGAVEAPSPPLDWRSEREAFERGVAEDVASQDR